MCSFPVQPPISVQQTVTRQFKPVRFPKLHLHRQGQTSGPRLTKQKRRERNKLRDPTALDNDTV